MADKSKYTVVTYQRSPGHWRAAIKPDSHTPDLLSALYIRGRTTTSFVMPDDSATESDAMLAAEKIIRRFRQSGLVAVKNPTGLGIGIGCGNEDHRHIVRPHVSRMRWRSVQSTDKMRRSLSGFSKSVCNACPSRGGHGNGSKQPVFWHLTSSGLNALAGAATLQATSATRHAI